MGSGRRSRCSLKTEQSVPEKLRPYRPRLFILASPGPQGPEPTKRKLPRKEVIQPQVLLQLPCYDFTPIASHSIGTCLLAVSSVTSRAANFRDVTGGVYKARERIHRGVLIRDY